MFSVKKCFMCVTLSLNILMHIDILPVERFTGGLAYIVINYIGILPVERLIGGLACECRAEGNPP